MYEELKLQNVILQYDADSNFRNYCELMHCRSNTKKAYNMVYDIEKKCHIIKQYDAVSFATYFNVLQVNAWKQKTYAEKFRLQLDFSGKAVVEIFEIYRSSKNVNINILKKVMLDSSERTKISIDIPNTRRPLVSFNIMAMEPFSCMVVPMLRMLNRNTSGIFISLLLLQLLKRKSMLRKILLC